MLEYDKKFNLVLENSQIIDEFANELEEMNFDLDWCKKKKKLNEFE